MSFFSFFVFIFVFFFFARRRLFLSPFSPPFPPPLELIFPPGAARDPESAIAAPKNAKRNAERRQKRSPKNETKNRKKEKTPTLIKLT